MNDTAKILGIKPIKVDFTHEIIEVGRSGGEYRGISEDKVRTLEQQKNKLLECLINQVKIQYSDNGDYACVSDETIQAIRNADPQHRELNEIMELS